MMNLRMVVAEEVAEEVRESEATGLMLTKDEAERHGLNVISRKDLTRRLQSQSDRGRNMVEHLPTLYRNRKK